MDNCSNHKKDLFGETDMKKAGRAICDMHYEALAELLLWVSEGLADDCLKDKEDGKTDLSKRLDSAGDSIYDAHMEIADAWKISKPFMKEIKGGNVETASGNV